MNRVNLIWTTPDGESLIGYMARVSNSKAKPDDSSEKLIRYLIDHSHWSPFEMVSACVEIKTTRDIARQILRHRSFSIQEFSQRYAEVDQDKPALREARLQDKENRQNSIKIEDEDLRTHWAALQKLSYRCCYNSYQEALKCGIAKEQARALLPEGLTNTRMYMAGNLRSWIHYWSVRCGPDTQLEHREVAMLTRKIILSLYPQLESILKEKGEFGNA